MSIHRHGPRMNRNGFQRPLKLSADPRELLQNAK
jgi:hypothetical protein